MENRKWPAWFRPGERMSDAELKQALSAPLPLPAAVLQRDAAGASKELPKMSEAPGAPAFPNHGRPPGPQASLTNAPERGGPQIKGPPVEQAVNGAQIPAVPTPQLPPPSQKVDLSGHTGTPQPLPPTKPGLRL